jgi:hypothetical protein
MGAFGPLLTGISNPNTPLGGPITNKPRPGPDQLAQLGQGVFSLANQARGIVPQIQSLPASEASRINPFQPAGANPFLTGAFAPPPPNPNLFSGNALFGAGNFLPGQGPFTGTGPNISTGQQNELKERASPFRRGVGTRPKRGGFNDVGRFFGAGSGRRGLLARR